MFSAKFKNPFSALLWLVAMAIAAALVPAPANAAPLPWEGRRIAIEANGEPLAPFLQRFFARLRIPVRTSEQVVGSVSGKFNERASVLFEELVDSYGLTWYYDGAVVFVYSIAEIESRLVTMQPGTAQKFPVLLDNLQISDERFPIDQAADEGYISVSGPPRYLERVEEVASYLGRALREDVRSRDSSPGLPPVAAATLPQRTPQAAKGQAVKVFRLKHAWAEDRVIALNGSQTVIQGVATLVQTMMGRLGPVPARPAPDPGMRLLPTGGKGLLGQGLASRRPGGAAQPEVAVAERPVVFGQSGPVDGTGLVQADTRLNAVIVRDSADRIPMYEELIRSLDQPVPLVEIEATVIDISSESAEALGVDFSLLLSNRPGRTVAPIIGVRPEDIAAGVAPRAQVVLGNEKNFLFARIDALKQTGDATIQSQPRVLTVDNSEAILSSTQEFFVRVAGREAVDLFNVNVGLTLRVTPSIIQDADKNRFKLQVRIDDGAIASVDSVDDIPVISRSGIGVNVIVDEGESLFIGGLSSERVANGRRGVPGLSNIPVLGALFRTDRAETRKVQRMFLLTPKLIKGAL